jgi:hypothetical protein
MSRQERENTFRTTESQTMTRPGVISDVERRNMVAGPVTWEEMRALLRREPTAVYERTWRPTVGGLLSILAGSWNFLLGLGAVFGGTIFTDLIPTFGGVTGGINTASTAAGIFFLVIGIVSIIGGAFALARRFWPMVLAGSITAIMPTPLVIPFIMGFFALIFNVLGHKEFWGPRQFQKDYQSNVEHNLDK